VIQLGYKAVYFRLLVERAQFEASVGAKRSQPTFAAVFEFMYPEYGGIVKGLYKSLIILTIARAHTILLSAYVQFGFC